MNDETRVLLSSYDSNIQLVQHFAILFNVENKTGEKLRQEMKEAFNSHVSEKRNESQYLTCRYMFVQKSKENIEWRLSSGVISPIDKKYQMEIFWYKPDIGIQFKAYV